MKEARARSIVWSYEKRVHRDVETSVPSYLAAGPIRDVRAAAWQELTLQWWDRARPHYEIFTSEVVVAEATGGDPGAAERRIAILRDIPELPVDEEVEALPAKLVAQGGFPQKAQVDALHVAVAAVHGIDFLLTWNCRHINNADTKPLIRSICAMAGYKCPEICTPQELLPEEDGDVSG